jgi:hypothetical protein
METERGEVKITPAVTATYIYDRAFGDDEYYVVRVSCTGTTGGRGYEVWNSLGGWPSDEALAREIRNANWVVITEEQIQEWLESDNSFWSKK